MPRDRRFLRRLTARLSRATGLCWEPVLVEVAGVLLVAVLAWALLRAVW